MFARPRWPAGGWAARGAGDELVGEWGDRSGTKITIRRNGEMFVVKFADGIEAAAVYANGMLQLQGAIVTTIWLDRETGELVGSGMLGSGRLRRKR